MIHKVPVFVVHRGKSKCLDLTLQSIKSSDNRPIYIGDQHDLSESYESYINVSNTEEYDDFLSCYVHMSGHSQFFEIACFRRYFDVYAISEILGLDYFWMADSDLLMLCSLERVTESLRSRKHAAALSTPGQGSETLIKFSSPHLSFWTRDGLASFLNFLLNTYKENIEVLEKIYQPYREKYKVGGICDMTLLYMWAGKRDDVANVIDINSVDGYIFDHNINEAVNLSLVFKKDPVAGIKKLSIVDGKYGSEDLNGFFPFQCLHFQGRAKIYMPGAAWIIEHRVANPILIRASIYFSGLYYFVVRAAKKFKNIFKKKYG